jgi:hypothetical protein
LLCWQRIWVTAAMWTAWFIRRFPRSDSRQTTRPPEDTSAGAVPLQAAKLSGPGKREMSPTSPGTAAATAGPAPKISVTVVPEARTAAAGFFWTSRRWIPVRRRPVGNCPASTHRAAPAAQVRSGQGAAPGQQPLSLRGAGPYPHLAQHLLRRPDRHRGMRLLMRARPDHHRRHRLAPFHSSSGGGSVAGMPNSGSVSGRTSSGPRHGRVRRAGTPV